MIKVTINPGQRKLIIPKNILVLNVLKQAHISIPNSCGGYGNCGKCKVIVSPQHSVISSIEKTWLSEKEIKKGFRLACQCHLDCSSIITLPSYINIDKEHSIVKGKINSHLLLNNNFKPVQQIKKIYLQLKLPVLQDQRSDWTRIKNGLETQLKNQDLKIPIDILSKIPKMLRNNEFKLTLSLFKDTVIAAETGDTRNELYGIAFDIGTTTIAGYLLNLSSFKEIGVKACDNPQSMYGDDVISRIDFAQEDPKGKKKLQKELINTLNQIIFSLSKKAEIDIQQIYLAVLVGNTCMHHFLWFLSTENLAISPYIPVITNSILKESRDIPHLCLIPHARVYTAPNVSAYIGGDIIADMIDISVWRKKDNILMVDLGTNGEIVLSSSGRIWACATAAGPTFEGARISSGMRATYGAIDRVRITSKKVDYHVIGHSKAVGICGSGIVCLIAELLKLKIIRSNGQLVKQEECPNNVDNTIKERIIQGRKYNQFLLVPAQESASGEPIYLTQKDIREVQLAKGAVAAGICILLEKARIGSEDIGEILLAGAFGNFLDTASALEIGIIPHVPLEKVRSIGNAAGQGAEKLLLSEEMRNKAEQISKQVQYVELSSDHSFQKIFTKSLFFNYVV